MKKVVTWGGASKVIRDAQDGELPPDPTPEELRSQVKVARSRAYTTEATLCISNGSADKSQSKNGLIRSKKSARVTHTLPRDNIK